MSDTPYTDKRKVVIFFAITQEVVYLQYLLSILTGPSYKFSDITLCVLEGNTILSRSRYWKFTERREKIERIKSSVVNFQKYYSGSLDIIFTKCGNPKETKAYKKLSELKSIDIILYNSVRSVLATSRSKTAFRDYPIQKFRRYANGLVHDYECATEMINESGLLEINKDAIFIFLNGRHPGQAAIRRLLEEHNLEFLSFEWGEPADQRFHLNNFQVQELRYLQNSWMKERANFSNSMKLLARQEAKNWLSVQSSSNLKNQFLTPNDSEIFEKLVEGKSSLVTIFTSSVEEDIYNLGEDTNGWDSQIQAIVECSKFLSSKSYSVLVRIHPNASYKSWLDLTSLVKKLESEGIGYVLPWDPISSYLLIRKSSLVGTWVSRIGIEAAAMGVPTFALGLSPYSIASNLKTISPTNLDDLLYLPEKKTDDEAVLLTIYQMHNFGHEISQYIKSDFIRGNSDFEILIAARLKRMEKLLYFSNKAKVRLISYLPTPFGYFATPKAIDYYFVVFNENIRRKIKIQYLNYLTKKTLDISKFKI
jgi:hypothetical protein